MDFLEVISKIKVGETYSWVEGGFPIFIDELGAIYRNDINGKVLLMHKNLFLGEWKEIK